jgi:16S rRNA (adenine1518-N6/adenine1519-N6)-dimethyltransferase
MSIVEPQETKNILRKYNIHLTKKLGQHFLVDTSVVTRILAAAHLSRNDTILEVGPGIGTMTEALAGAAGHVVAVEYDRRFAAVLGDTLAGLDNVEIVQADAMKVDLAAFKANKLVSNLPYNIASALISKVLADCPGISEMVVMVQKEVAARMTATTGREFGFLAILIQAYGDIESVCDVSSDAFLPHPAVESTVVKIHRLAEPRYGVDTERFLAFAGRVFSERRKTIRSVLVNAGYEKEAVGGALKAAGIEAARRPDTVSALGIYDLFRALNT